MSRESDSSQPRGRAVWPIALGIGVIAIGAGALALSGTFSGTPTANGSTSATPSPSTTPATEPPESPTPAASADDDVLAGLEFDALQEVHLDELRDFIAWLDEHDAEGFVGEVGWDNAGDAEWTTLGEYWYLLAEQEGLWTTGWAAGTAWPLDYRLLIYGEAGSGSLDTGSPQGDIIERLEAERTGDSPARHGVNVAGLDFGTNEDFSNVNLGELGGKFQAEPLESYAWLADRGIDLVRLPVRWERLQPELDGPLDADHVALVTAQLDAAAAAGIDVILDLHNYGSYVTQWGASLVGSEWLTTQQFTDFWLDLADTWGEHPAIAGWGLMNEPNNLGAEDAGSPALLWERVSQEAVTALREAGDEHLILVAGYDWSSLAKWRSNHPTGWISDPADNFRYEAHHYWDSFGAGSYDLSYAEELAALTGG
ncbi:glycoside hydrolase family 5 protein [Demequina pelophila]|uniref:glycoside hydrolase family 5 protein n=1 Tax=Demequina pelophila TaxID=1638984 RepID=UPI000784D345|nr:cellulase family glycosylhydrolase [Demequina pelophila]